ncbi:MAG: hypothetical protein LBC75_08530 [Fibromonadaceae bacterium]|jgi:hypothetical protein|nr:hypothetical protein [Fibromonadaceae bacterium]
MESILNLIINAENARMLLMLVFGFSGFILLKTSLEKKIDGATASLGKRIDEVDKRIDELKYNDFAHLNSTMDALKNTIEALTFTLEKNGSLSKEDKEFVDSRLTI